MTRPQQIPSEPEAKLNRTRTVMLVRAVGIVFAAVFTVLFGLVPSLLGLAAQALSPRPIPAFVAGPLAAAAFFALWYFTGWLSTTIGDGSMGWASMSISLILFVAFFASGAAFFRELLPRRSTTASASRSRQAYSIQHEVHRLPIRRSVGRIPGKGESIGI